MKLIKAIPLFMAFVSLVSILSSCSLVDEKLGDCPTDMLLSFHIDDRHEAGDFDERIGNDVLLYIFQNGVCVAKMTVPYGEIAKGKPYAIRKTDQISGNLQMVAWAVPANGDLSVLPSWQLGAPLGSTEISLEALGSTGYYAAVTNQLYLGTLSVNERINEPTSHSIGMNYSYCRVEVHVAEPSGSILNVPEGASIRVLGSKAGMNMQLQGTGADAIVPVALKDTGDKGVSYATGRFGIFPSAEGKTVSIEIYAGDVRQATLNVPRENMPKGAEAGGLLIFEYTLNSGSFTLIVNGYRLNIYDVDMI
ncbi:MAG: FimB/Mfa2 family fimbrial subunit [Proteiniphilum sp.]|jgi:hypothetical protein|nr:FimB/Mfa2 family fimbrial subunit [Proteiniphilum sp.]